eukprot:gnl/Chilomastix_caulleri/5027.p1 GENE.gnl/Chilomastix_caulleri/5027~~gnl/Chilomastix_caulleri/5027.p1  ORF type:complete len:91 (+),score=15.03 gnl/Chilomastix_caulleri/5027:91-363(+)
MVLMLRVVAQIMILLRSQSIQWVDSPNYGNLKNDFMMIAGCCVGTKRRCVTLRTPIAPAKSYTTQLKWISTASKMGHGRFQTSLERAILR